MEILMMIKIKIQIVDILPSRQRACWLCINFWQERVEGRIEAIAIRLPITRQSYRFQSSLS